MVGRGERTQPRGTDVINPGGWRLRRLRGDEPVSEPALGSDVAGRVGIITQLVAQPADVHADVVDLVDLLAAPHLGEERRVLEHVPRVSHKVIEQLVFGRRQVQPLAAEAGLVLREVDLQIAGP